MTLLDMPRPPQKAKRQPIPAEARLKDAEAKLRNAQARHKRAAESLEKTKALLARAIAASDRDARAERMAWDRVANVMREFERIQRACGND